MAQQGYGRQGYGNSYGRSRQHATVTGEYKSAFNPIPIEFLQEQLRGRQKDYDTAFAGAIQAKEQMASQQAAMQDLGSKNEIIGDTMGNIDKVVEEKYGGNWSLASKEIATMVSSARMNPFWEKTKHLSEQQKIQQDFQLKNPNSWVYNDTMKQSTIDPKTGEVRSTEDLTFRGGQRSNFAQSIELQYDDIVANIQDMAARKVDQNGIQGMIGQDRVEEVTEQRIKDAARDGVDTFLTNNPDYLEGHMSQGMTEEEVRAQAEATIYGQISDKIHKKSTTQLTKDPSYGAGAGGAGGTGADAIVRSQAAQYVSMVGIDVKEGQALRQNVNAELAELEGRTDPDSEIRIAELEATRQQMDDNFDFIYDSMQDGADAVDLDAIYEEYGAEVEKEQKSTPEYQALNKEEFDARVMEHLRNGTRERSSDAQGFKPRFANKFSPESKKINE